MPRPNYDIKPAFARLHVYLLAVLLALGATSAGCAEQTWRSTTEVLLEGVRIGVDGSWAVAIEHQGAAESAAINAGAVRAAGLDADGRQAVLEEVQRELLLIRQRHHEWYGKFRFIRQLHATAVAAYEAYRNGRGTRAAFFAAMEPLLGAWHELQALLPSRGQPDVPVADAAAPTSHAED